MGGRTLDAFREARRVLFDADTESPGAPLTSIRDATYVHQRYALSHGYNSLLELAIDELAGEIRELKERVDALETARKELDR